MDQLPTEREAITQCIYRCARGLDRLDRALIRSCYHDDAIDSRPPLFEGPVDDFLDWVMPVLGGLQASTHLIGNVLIELNDDQAASESYFVATLRATGDGGETIETVRGGRYIDDFRRRDGRWAIQRRIAVIDWSRKHRLAVADVAITLPGTSAGAQHPIARDRTDVSYRLLANGRA